MRYAKNVTRSCVYTICLNFFVLLFILFSGLFVRVEITIQRLFVLIRQKA